MSRQEDFEKSAIDYCEDHSHCIYFEFGAEYGYQYAQTHPNWQQVRIQAAIAAMQGMTPEWGNNARQYAEWAVQVADALVEELQKKGGE